MLNERENIEESSLLRHDAASLGDWSFQNIANHSPNDTASHFRRHESSNLAVKSLKLQRKILI